MTGSQHIKGTRSFRPEVAQYDAALQVLKERDWEMDAFLRACISRLLADPDSDLASLAAHRPAKARRGRPWPSRNENKQGGDYEGMPG